MLCLLLSLTSVAALAEAGVFTHTGTELHGALATRQRNQSRSSNAETAEAVCLAFIEYMQELRCPVEYTTDLVSATGFQPMFDTELNSRNIAVVLMSGGCEVTLTDGLVGNEAHIRDCMVSLAMAAAQVEGVEIFNGEISAAMDSCMEDFPAGFDADAL